MFVSNKGTDWPSSSVLREQHWEEESMSRSNVSQLQNRSNRTLISLVVLLLPVFAATVLAQPPNPNDFEMMPAKKPIKAPGAMNRLQPPLQKLQPAVDEAQTPSPQYQVVVLRKVCHSANDYKRAEAQLNEYGNQGYQVVGMLIDRTGAILWTLQRKKLPPAESQPS
jgi:hypothetical protein